MRTIFVESRTSTFISTPASLVNTRLFPEIDLIVPSGAGDLAFCAGSCAATASTATEPPLHAHAAITVAKATRHKRCSPGYLTLFSKIHCSGDFMIPSSISYFRAKAHLSLPIRRVTCTKSFQALLNIAQNVVAAPECSYLPPTRRPFTRTPLTNCAAVRNTQRQ